MQPSSLHISRHVWRYYLVAVLAVIGGVFFNGDSPARAGTATTTTIVPDTTWGRWDGWGTSLAWWASVFGDRDDLADAFFTVNQVRVNGAVLPGLGLTFVRYNAGATSASEVDGRTMAISPKAHRSRLIDAFWLDGKSDDPGSPSWNWTADANQRAMLLKARDRGADRFELFSNSPPWWMCANRNPSGAARALDNNLPPENYARHAVYLATIAKYAREHWNLTFSTVEPFNEPFSDYWSAASKQEGCHFSHEAQAAVIPLLRAELDKRGLQTMPIAASDETNYDMATATWASFDGQTKAMVGQVNVHGYQGPKGRRDALYDAVSRDKKPLVNSEYGGPDPTGLALARDLHLDFRYLHPTRWTYWQPLDGNGWGFIFADLERKFIGNPAPKYYVMAQYSRHIRPGMTILETGDTDTVAAWDAGKRKLVIVALNGPAQIAKTFDFSKFATAAGPVTAWTTEPRATRRYELRRDLAVSEKRLQVVLSADSVQTFEIENVSVR